MGKVILPMLGWDAACATHREASIGNSVGALLSKLAKMTDNISHKFCHIDKADARNAKNAVKIAINEVREQDQVS